MPGKHQYMGAVLTILAITVTALASLPGHAAADVGESEIPKSCIQKDSNGGMVWVGGYSLDLDRLGDELQDLVEAHPDDFAGAAYCSDYSGVYVSTKNRLSKELQKEIEKLKAKNPKYEVYVKPVKFSKNELESVVDSIGTFVDTIPGMLGYGPDYMEGVVEAIYHQDEASDPQEIRSKVLAGLSKTGNVKVPIVMKPGLPAVADVGVQAAPGPDLGPGWRAHARSSTSQVVR